MTQGLELLGAEMIFTTVWSACKAIGFHCEDTPLRSGKKERWAIDDAAVHRAQTA